MGMYGNKYLTIDCSVDYLTGEKIGSMTKQSFVDECDINKIIARFEKTGMIENVNRRKPFYGDVTSLRSYQESLNVVQEAEQLFRDMDAHVRARFENDPAQMIAFLADAKNRDEAVKLGMILPKADPPKGPAPVVPPAPSAGGPGAGPTV